MDYMVAEEILETLQEMNKSLKFIASTMEEMDNKLDSIGADTVTISGDTRDIANNTQ